MPPMPNSYDPNPWDNVTLAEAIAQLYRRVNSRTLRQVSTLLRDGESSAVRIVEIRIDENNHLIFKLSDGTEMDAGEMVVSAGISEPITATVDIGKITAGTTYPAGTSVEDIIRDMLVKYLKPTVTLTLNPAATLYDAVTGSIVQIKLTAVVKKNTNPVTQLSFAVGGTVVHTITSGVAEGGTFTYTYTPATPITSTTTFSANVTDGQESSASTISVVFIGKSYYGIVADEVSQPTAAQIKALSSTLKNSRTYAYSGISMEYAKVCYAYPKSLGNLTSIKDEINNVNYMDSFARTEVRIDGIDYVCYTQIDSSFADGVTITFR